MRAIRRFTVRITLPEPLAPLQGLMLNLRWSWHAPTADLFASIDPAAWAAAGRRPDRDAERAAAAADRRPSPPMPTSSARCTRPSRTCARTCPARAGTPSAGLTEIGPAAVAYFSPEYGITAALPQYSGGLGILAGDHLKSASDLGVPLIGVGLLYRHGYFTQSLSADGWQAERYPGDDPNGLPLELLRDASGARGPRRRVGLPAAARRWPPRSGSRRSAGSRCCCSIRTSRRTSQTCTRSPTGCTAAAATTGCARNCCSASAGCGPSGRSARCTGHPAPEVFHTNEGHAGFLGLERIREYAERGLSFDEAMRGLPGRHGVHHAHPGRRRASTGSSATWSGALRRRPAAADRPVLALGAETYPGGDPDVFNMAVMGMRLAQRVNGVCPLHGQVSREMFAGLWPGFDTARGADRLGHQRRAHPDLGGARGACR